jgi:hypothetical protein
MEKNRVKMATEISKSNFADRKLRIDDDFRRDDMVVKGLLDAAKIEAQFAVDVNEAEIESENTPQEVLQPAPAPLQIPAAIQQMMGQTNASADSGLVPEGTAPPV